MKRVLKTTGEVELVTLDATKSVTSGGAFKTTETPTVITGTVSYFQGKLKCHALIPLPEGIKPGDRVEITVRRAK